MKLLYVTLFGCSFALIPLTSDNWHVGKYLMVIDNYILEILNTTKYNKGKRLLDHVSDYYKTFKEFRDEVRKKMPLTKEAVDFMVEYKGPQFIHKKLDDRGKEKLFRDYENLLQKYENITEKTKVLWTNFLLDVAD